MQLSHWKIATGAFALQQPLAIASDLLAQVPIEQQQRVVQISNSGPVIMGIVNVTPDSFSDGGQYCHPKQTLAHANTLINHGAHMLDIGSESTRPGAQAVNGDMQLARLEPLLDHLVDCTIPISIDTSHPDVITRVAQHPRVVAINDVRALQNKKALEACAQTNVGICLMHMQGQPHNMQNAPQYVDVCQQVQDFLLARVQHCVQAGIDSTRIVIDPGFGFGKTFTDNLRVFASINKLSLQGFPVLIGVSRKRMIGEIHPSLSLAQRDYSSAFAAVLAWKAGAKILRVHNVQATIEMLHTYAMLGE